MLEFEAFAFLVAKFIAIQEDEPDTFEDELREAFRLYDKEVISDCISKISILPVYSSYLFVRSIS